MVVDKTANRAGICLYMMLLLQLLSRAKTDVSLREMCVYFCNQKECHADKYYNLFLFIPWEPDV